MNSGKSGEGYALDDVPNKWAKYDPDTPPYRYAKNRTRKQTKR
jgi:hypothetical protein